MGSMRALGEAVGGDWRASSLLVGTSKESNYFESGLISQLYGKNRLSQTSLHIIKPNFLAQAWLVQLQGLPSHSLPCRIPSDTTIGIPLTACGHLVAHRAVLMADAAAPESQDTHAAAEPEATTSPRQDSSEALRQLTILRTVLRSVEGENARLRAKTQPPIQPSGPASSRRFLKTGPSSPTPLKRSQLQPQQLQYRYQQLSSRRDRESSPPPSDPASRSRSAAPTVSSPRARLAGLDSGSPPAPPASPPPLSSGATLAASLHRLGEARAAELEAQLREAAEAEARAVAEAVSWREEAEALADEATALRARVQAIADDADAWQAREEEREEAAEALQARVEELQVGSGGGEEEAAEELQVGSGGGGEEEAAGCFEPILYSPASSPAPPSSIARWRRTRGAAPQRASAQRCSRCRQGDCRAMGGEASRDYIHNSAPSPPHYRTAAGGAAAV